MSTKILSKDKTSTANVIVVNNSDIDHESSLSQNDNSDGGGSNVAHHNPNEGDLFSFLSAMHLSGGTAGGQINAAAAAHVFASRKRKFLDQGGGAHVDGGSGSGKLFGGMRPPGHRRSSDDEDHPLHTPQCSQSGFADDEDQSNQQTGDDDDSVQQQHISFKGRQGMLSPSHQPIIGDIDENLAADFDGSLSGLGVDMNAATYSMSEALMALPNLSIGSGQMFKQEVSSPPVMHRQSLNAAAVAAVAAANSSSNTLKEEPLSNMPTKASGGHHSPVLDALDLSSDEAARFPEDDTSEESIVHGPNSFTGSVARDGAPMTRFYHSSGGSVQQQVPSQQQLQQQLMLQQNFAGSGNLSSSHPNLSSIGRPQRRSEPSTGSTLDDRMQKLVAPLQSSSSSLASRNNSQEMINEDANGSMLILNNHQPRFQYILNASTSIATKVNEPSITYLNQGQGYELSLKRLGGSGSENLSSRKRHLKTLIRICFHERRLQYMEMEQISEWSNKHPSERILDIDLPLSYGVSELVKDPCNLNVVTFKWDPNRETGIFIKVNCISTEFTPKKHGGEKGVPFRLQVETFDLEDNRLHAGGCVLQVFKLKGADRKHKQDRDKIQKRPLSEQEKFARPYEKTILNDLTPENIYVPQSSRSDSPELVLIKSGSGSVADGVTSHSRHNSRDESPAMQYYGSSGSLYKETITVNATVSNGVIKPIVTVVNTATASSNVLSATASVEAVTQWLGRNRYGSLLANFRNYNGRDLLRLSREDVIALCGLSDGLRLYNDLHMAPVAPRTTFYVALKDTDKYDALFLDDLTVAEFVRRFALCLGFQQELFGAVFKRSSKGFLFRVTDEVIQYTDPESVFFFSLKHSDAEGGSEKCDIILENALPPFDRNTGTNSDSVSQ